MKCEKIVNLLDIKSDNVPRFITKKWIEVHDQSGKPYSINKQIRFKTSMLHSILCDYIDAYIVVKEVTNVQTENNRAIDEYRINLTLKNNTPFINCISKI